MRIYKVVIGLCLCIHSFAFAAETSNPDMHGVANLNNATAKANVQVAGLLTSKHGKFFGDVSLKSNHAIFIGSTIKGSITVHSILHPLIELRCGTRITGGVTFEGSPGVIKKSKKSSVEGKVVNGIVEEIQQENC